MSYRLSMDDLGEFLTLKRQNIVGINKNSFEDKLYNFQMQETVISEDISFMRWEFHPNEDIEVYGSYNTNALDIRIALDGNINNYNKNTNSNTNIKKNEIASTYSKELVGSEFYKKDVKLKSMSILIKDNFLNKYLSADSKILKSIDKIDHYKIFKHKELDYNKQIVANQLFNLPIFEELDQIKIQSLVYDLIYDELKDSQSLENKEINSQIKYSEYDLNALEKAKIILSKNIQNPPSICELAKIVKLNEFKLKYGFKKLFNNTPYSYLLDIRMQEARTLLETSDYNINEIASLVGYKQPSSFSKAFLKKYNILPKEIMKKRSYYY